MRAPLHPYKKKQCNVIAGPPRMVQDFYRKDRIAFVDRDGGPVRTGQHEGTPAVPINKIQSDRGAPAHGPRFCRKVHVSLPLDRDGGEMLALFLVGRQSSGGGGVY